jgi:hypothetical protein
VLPELTTEAATRTGRGQAAGSGGRADTTTAAAPSPLPQHCSRVSGSATGREPSTSSSGVGRRNWASGLSAPLAWFFTETAARSSATAPVCAMYRCARIAYAAGMVRPWAISGSSAFSRSVPRPNTDSCSTPMTSAVSNCPARIAVTARCSATAELEQAASTL